MIKLWRKLIFPLMTVGGVKTIMEIGAESGESTETLLKYVSENKGHLYSIDPAPEFDSDKFKVQYPSCYTFYRELSLDVLPQHKTFDAVLVDGDHNWFTVFNELKEIETIHGQDALDQPLTFIHDIGWPYGRRDLYYNPETIPAKYRHNYHSGGILPNCSELKVGAGINAQLNNASHEGGERNGVMTGVEDYIAQSKIDFVFIKMPLYYGLGILISKLRLKNDKSLRLAVERLESKEGINNVAYFAEHLRCVDAVFMQTISRRLEVAERRVVELEEQLNAENEEISEMPIGEKV